MDQTLELLNYAARLSADDLARLMDISDKLASLNHARFRAFSAEHGPDNARPALLAFKGDVYLGLEAETLDAAGLSRANQRLRILSGLYGLLRPLDLMQPYRLEMGTALSTSRGKTLYAFWENRIADLLAADLADHDDPTLINLASQEYFGAVKPERLPGRVIACHFKEVREGEPKIISFFAKKARGAMARFIIDGALDRPDGCKDFAWGGYGFAPRLSDETNWVFTRVG
jgi:uncharacterized protein